MRERNAAIVGGILAGLATTAVMVAGRKSGALTKTLDRDAVDWIDNVTGSRRVIGEAGTSTVEFANHIGTSAAFGAAVPTLRGFVPQMSAVTFGALYGTALYTVNIGAIAPMLGITRGEVQAGPRKAAERWGIHVMQGVLTTVLADELTTKRRHIPRY